MLNKAKIFVAFIGFRIFRKFIRTQQTAEVFTSPSPYSFYEFECESESQRHESKSESSKSGLESSNSVIYCHI